MKFEKVQFVYVDVQYLEYLHSIEPEIFFDKKNESYRLKPHLGILIQNEDTEYVIPLTSAKEKHKFWPDVTANWYRIYEIVNIEKDKITEHDILVEIKNHKILQKLCPKEAIAARQRILSVLDIRKMFPADKSVYRKIDFKIDSNSDVSTKQRTFLMIKEYNFLYERSKEIELKATKIYEKQVKKQKVLPYHCDYLRLEKALENYKKISQEK